MSSQPGVPWVGEGPPHDCLPAAISALGPRAPLVPMFKGSMAFTRFKEIGLDRAGLGSKQLPSAVPRGCARPAGTAARSHPGPCLAGSSPFLLAATHVAGFYTHLSFNLTSALWRYIYFLIKKIQP